MLMFKNTFKKELLAYKNLGHNAQKLIKSIFLYNIISPLLGIFVNAFLWRETKDFQKLAVYNLTIYLGIILGFYLNGLLLKKYKASTLYTLGAFLQGFSIFLLIFITRTDYVIISFFGFIFGIAGGIFWANRNLLTLKTTQTNNRIYFSGLESNIGTISDIAIPVSIGWLIVAGEAIHLYSPLDAYKFLAILILLVITSIGFALKNLSITIPPPTQLLLSSISSNWNKFRLFEFVLGLLSGIGGFVPVLMVLSVVGKENALGSIQSLSAIIAILVVSVLAKSLQVKHRIKLLGISVLLSIAGALVFSLTYSTLGVYIFYAMSALATPFGWIAMNSINYDLIDEEKDHNLHYAYVCDQEIYLNAGRITAIFIFILLDIFSNNAALRFTPLIVACSQILLFFIAKRIKSDNEH
ncbi:MAG TPA: MFS transporter [Candidatus Saccharimonadales bacterium]|nr:MFS transporter [Candidatus Saccharimonadales bacterium]